MTSNEKIKKFLNSSESLLNTSKTMMDIFKYCFVKHGNKVAFEYYDDRGVYRYKTYKKAKKDVIRYANNLLDYLPHIKAHSIVILKLNNSPSWCELFWAILLCGFKPLLVNANLRKGNVNNLIKQSGAQAIISDDPFSYDVIKVNALDVISLKKSKPHFLPGFENEVIFCSSGTTGEVKLMVYNGENLCYQIASSMNMGDSTNNIMYPKSEGECRILAMIPFHHVFGFMAIFLWYTYYGKTLVFPNSMNSKEIQDLCKFRRITHVYSVPLFWDSLATQLVRAKEQSDDLKKKLVNEYMDDVLNKRKPNPLVEQNVKLTLLGSRIRFAISGGGYLSKETSKTINSVGYELHNGFGMTEIGVTSVDLSNDIDDRLTCSIGKPFHGVTYKIGDDNELLVKSNTIHTKEIINGVIKETSLDEDGYFHTGDIVEIGEKGEYYIKGRMKDVIINADGENVYPDELELYFKDVKNILGYCILGIRSKTNKNKEDITFVAQIRTSISSDEVLDIKKEIFDISKTLPRGSQIEKIYFTSCPLPVANNMKVKRSLIKQDIESNSNNYMDDITTDVVLETKFDDRITKEIVEPLKAIFSEVLLLPTTSITNDSHWINDLGGDSMNFFELVGKVNDRFNITVPQDMYSELASITDFVNLILELKEN